MHQLTVGVGADRLRLIHHGNMGPFARRRDIAGIDPVLIPIWIDEGPADRAIGKARDPVFTLPVDDDAARRGAGTGRRRTDPRLDAECGSQMQRSVGLHADGFTQAREHQGTVGLSRWVHQRRIRVRTRQFETTIVQNAVDFDVGVDRRRAAQVEQSEAEVSRCIGDAIDHQAVVTSGQVQQWVAARIHCIRLVEAPCRDLGSLRAAQGPAERAVAQRIEEHHGVRIERERVGLALPWHLDPSGNGLSKRD